MKKKIFIGFFVLMCVMILAVATSAAAPLPQKPELDVNFGDITAIDGFTPPSELYINTDERVLLVDENGNYVTYPTYYVTKDSTTFDFDFSKLNAVQTVQYAKKSVVMLEIPDGVTTISGSYFAGTGNFPVCVSVQFPGSVTSYGASMFSTNTVIEVVEFLDGTEPITMGDAMFGSNWEKGANNIKYVKFPNNLVSIGNNTFGKAKGASKTIIFGENLKVIGTGFFGESTPNTTDTFLYVSDKFFAEDEVFTNLFGNEAPYHGNNLRLTMFYTGTKAQAEAFIAKCVEVQPSGYLWQDGRVKVVSASEYDYSTHKPSSNVNITIVYDFGKCDAFYNGVHNTVKQNDCVEACTNCGVGVIKHADANAENITLTYANGFVNKGSKHIVCTNEGCGYDVTLETKPIFETEGYSVPEDGRGEIAICFIVNKTELNEYEQYVDNEYSYGAFAIAYNKIVENGSININDTVKAEVDKEYASFEIKLSGFLTDAHKNAQITFGAYMTDKNGNIIYVIPGTPKDGDDYVYVTYNEIANS